MPHDYTKDLAQSQQNFLSVLPPPQVPQITPGVPLNNVSYAIPDTQSVSKCPGDYNQIPYGWRPSPFMGKCGYKIQLNKFYSADSPCYPVQDLSCMGPDQKKAWAFMCKTEFPCKPFTVPSYPKPYLAPPAWLKPRSSSSQTQLGMDGILQVISDTILPALGVTAACFLFSSSLASRGNDSESDSSSDSESNKESKK
jgi:hypothetical protein